MLSNEKIEELMNTGYDKYQFGEYLKALEYFDDVILEFTGAGCHKYAIKRALELTKDDIIIIYCKNRDFSILLKRLKYKELNENFPFNTDIKNHINFIKEELDEKEVESFWKMNNSILINVYMDTPEDITENMKIIRIRVKPRGRADK